MLKEQKIPPRLHLRSERVIKSKFDGIEGYFTWPMLYTDMVRKFPNDSVFVELGVFKGRSLYFLLDQIKKQNKSIKVTGIDFYKALSEYTYNETIANLSEFTNYDILNMDSVVASGMFEDNSVDFIFIDAGHTYEEVFSDIVAWLPKMKKGSIMAGHDYNATNKPGGYPGVQRAVRGIFRKRVSRRYIDEDCWLVRI